MHSLPIPALSALLRAALFWVFWLVLLYALLRVSGPPPPEGLAIGEWLGAGREWFDRLLDGTPGTLPDNAALRAAFNAMPSAPESGALLATMLWLALLWLGLSGLLAHASLLAPPLFGFGTLTVGIAAASTFVRAPRAIVMLSAVLIVLIVVQRGVAGDAASGPVLAEATATPEPAASPAPAGATATAGTTATWRRYQVRDGDSLLSIAAAELGSARRFIEIRNADGSALTSFFVAPGQELLLPGVPLQNAGPAAGAVVPTATATPAATPEQASTSTPTPTATPEPTPTATPAATAEPTPSSAALTAGLAAAAVHHDIEPPWPPDPGSPGAGFSAGAIVDGGRALVTSRAFVLGGAALGLAGLAGLLVLALRRGLLPVRRVRRALRKRPPLPSAAPRSGSVIEATGVLQIVVEGLAGRQVTVRPLLVREYKQNGYELLLRCEPGSASRAAGTVPDVSWRLGMGIEALVESPDLVLLRCNSAPSWSGPPDRSGGLVPCGAAGGDRAVYLSLVSAGSAAIVAPVVGRRALLREWLTSLRASAGPQYQIWSDDESAELLGFPDAGSGPCSDLLARLRAGPAIEQEGVVVLSPAGAAALGAAGDLALDPRRRYELIVTSATTPPEWPGATLAYGDEVRGEIAQRRYDLFQDEEDLRAIESAADLLLVMPALPDHSAALSRLVVQRGEAAVPLPAPLPIEEGPILLVDEPGPLPSPGDPGLLPLDPTQASGAAPSGPPPPPGDAPLADASPAADGLPVAGGQVAAGVDAGAPLSPAAAPGRDHSAPASADATTTDTGEAVPRTADAVLIAAARQLDPDPLDEFLPEAIGILEGALAAALRSESSHLDELKQRLTRLQARTAGPTAPPPEAGTHAPDAARGGKAPAAAAQQPLETLEGGAGPAETPEDGAGAAETPEDGAGAAETPDDGVGLAATPEDDAGSAEAPEDGVGLAETPEDGAVLAATPEDDAGSAVTPEDDAGSAVTPEDGAGSAEAPDDGAGLAETPEDGAGSAVTLDDGAGSAEAPDDGVGLAETPEDGAGSAVTLDDGAGSAETPEDGVGLAETPEDGVGLAATPEDGVGLAATPEDGVGLAATPEDGAGSAETLEDGGESAATPEGGVGVEAEEAAPAPGAQQAFEDLEGARAGTDAPDEAPATARQALEAPEDGAGAEVPAVAGGAAAAEAAPADPGPAAGATARAAAARDAARGEGSHPLAPRRGSRRTAPRTAAGAPAEDAWPPPPAAVPEDPTADWPAPPARSRPLHADLLGDVRLSLRDARDVYRLVQLSESTEVLRYLMATFRGDTQAWPRAEVEEAIWPNLAQGQRANLLRKHCWDASELFRRAGAVAEDVRAVELRRDEVRIIGRLFGSDLTQFRELATAADAAAAAGDQDTALRSWQQASQLVTGVPLSGCSSAWVPVVQPSLQSEIVTALERGLECARAHGPGVALAALTDALRRAQPSERQRPAKVRGS